LDTLVGIPYTALFLSDKEQERRKVYGTAGKVRLQPYGGIEYRTPSNSWLISGELVSFMYLWAQVAHNVVFYPEITKKVFKVAPIEEVVATINLGDHEKALEIYDTVFDALKGYPYLSQPHKYMGNPGYHTMDFYKDFPHYIYGKGGANEVFKQTDVVDYWWENYGQSPKYGCSNVEDFMSTVGDIQ
jgi:hypothetical protein